MIRFSLVVCLLHLVANPAHTQTWEPINAGLTSPSVQVLAADPGNPEVLYAGTIFGGAFKRSAEGAWTVLSGDFAFDTITALAVSPANSNVILLGTKEFGAHLTTDGGASWKGVGAGGNVAFVRMFRFAPDDPLRILAATEGEGIYLSVDGGVEWGIISADVLSDFTRDVIFDPTDSRTIYAAATGIDDTKMRESTNGGGTWWESGTSITSTVTSLAISWTNTNFIYAGTEAGVFVSEDAAGVLELRPFTDQPVEVRAVAADPTNHLSVFAATSKGVFHTADAGNTWTATNDGLPTEDILALILAPRDPKQVYIGTGIDGVYSLKLTADPVVDVDADFDGSGFVDFADFLFFVAGFGRSSSDSGFDARTDLDDSGSVDFTDFLLFVAVFGT